MNFPKELKYSKSHEWVKMTGDAEAVIGLTDYAQDQLGDLVFVKGILLKWMRPSRTSSL